MDWTQLWHSVLQWVTLNSVAAYLVIFLVALSESLALVGLLVPGTVIMIGIGALVGSGALSLNITLLTAITGAVVGDGISYWLGRHYHQGLKALWPFRRYPRMLTRGEEFFQRHGGKSVLLGRFVGPVRPVIPVIAGMLEMPAGRFVLVNILSAVGWAFAYLIPGVLLGGSLTLIGAVSTRLSLLLLLLGLLLWLTFWLCRRAFGWLARLGPNGERLLLPLLCLSLFLASWVFLGVLEDLLTLDPLVQADQAVYQFLQSLRTPWGDQALVAITELGDGLVNVSIAGAVLLVLLLHRKFRAAGYWLLAVGGGAALVELFKWAMHRPRPIAIYQGVASWGFPSGHTTLSVVLYGFLAILLVRCCSPRWRWLPFGVAIGLSLLIAFSRLYLGAHWLSDVIGGLSLGWAWTTLLGIFYLRRPGGEIPARRILAAALLAMLLAGSVHIQSRHAQDLSSYQVQKQSEILSESAWLQTEWQRLPGWRVDLAGEVEEPLSFQWAGEPEQLAMQLVSQGWSRSTGIDPKTLLNLLVPQATIEQLPLLPRLNNGQQGALLMWVLQNGERLVLRLWPTEYRISEKSDWRLWVGSVESEQAIPIAGFLTLPRGIGDYASGLSHFQQALPVGAFTKLVQRPKQGVPLSRDWAGQTLLLAGSKD